MPKYVIERDAPGVGQMAPRDRKASAMKAKRVLHELGPDIHWLHSYVTDDKVYCVFIAANEEIIHEDARRRELPVTRISEVQGVFELADSELETPNDG